ncbi:MAG: SCP2 sterol-binding domain-containing protein [Legionellaceae bacterium]|nr:SCP2 sterol-binding domain-containing protein [Legionellaceae bacterium]
MIKKYSLIALQKAINHAMSLDDSMSTKIKPLHGKVLEVIISPLNAFFFITFTEGELRLLASYDGRPDTIIHSSPIGLIRLSLLPASKVRSLFNDKIRLSGDVELGQRVKTLFDEIDIDWEGHLAHFTGDVVAHQIGTFVREGQAFTQRISSSIRRNVTEYLQEEVRLFPPAEELRDFCNDVDELSLCSERLTAHINQLLVENEIN